MSGNIIDKVKSLDEFRSELNSGGIYFFKIHSGTEYECVSDIEQGSRMYIIQMKNSKIDRVAFRDFEKAILRVLQLTGTMI